MQNFFNIRTTNGSALPIKSTTGKSSAEITVTERTPLTMTFFFRAVTSSGSVSFPTLRVFSNVVNAKSGSKGFLKLSSVPYGTYNSSKCTYANMTRSSRRSIYAQCTGIT
ncbi:hypothetical protein PIB30_118093 [Stylosanthes scabra]|uniref:Uncharacterized protein n=1 Tax=Stylosanthes scabra TaxID=79078 RepID=A0ABU6VGN2_9FABA|nr:hypothetical protein [Stylosanthes scabra]